MNEEMNMTNVEIENEVEIDNTELDVFEGEESCGGILGIVLLAGSILGAGIAAWKNRDKITDKKNQYRIKKLEKQGYVVTKPVDDSVDHAEVDYVEVK